MLVRLRDAGKPLPSRALLLSPMVDATGTSPSWSANADVDWVEAEVGLRWAEMYAGGRRLQDAEVSPVNARLEGLPPILAIVGGAELLRDDAVRLAERARAAGVEIDLHIEPAMVWRPGR
jgi:monoterpene epsilon-lactone hydrolase